MVFIKENSNYFTAAIILAFGVLAGMFIFALAAPLDDIVFPIQELGGCENKEACKAYCDDGVHIDECLDFAEKHNLIGRDDTEKARKFKDIGSEGPGRCSNAIECQAYCNDMNHIDECLDFAERHDFMLPEELAEARKVAHALRGGAVLPGGCSDKLSCEAYCHNPDNIEECLVFGERAGLMEEHELKDARRMVQALQSGHRPPGDCKTKDECEAFCRVLENLNECLDFAEAAGFMNEREIEEARRVAPLFARGETPGQCQNHEECDIYCRDDAHAQECLDFGVKAGFVSEEEAAQFRATGGHGPGDCSGRDECENFCNNPDNQQACFDFAREHNLIPEEELTNIQEGKRHIEEAFDGAPPEVATCLKSMVGQNVVDEINAGTLLPGPEIGDHVRRCFEEFMPQPEHFDGDFTPPDSHDGEFPPRDGFIMPMPTPGGESFPMGFMDCSNREECDMLCGENKEECVRFFEKRGDFVPPPGSDLIIDHDQDFGRDFPEDLIRNFEEFKLQSEPEEENFIHEFIDEGISDEGLLHDSAIPEETKTEFQSQPPAGDFPDSFNQSTELRVLGCEELKPIPSLDLIPPELRDIYVECFPDRI